MELKKLTEEGINYKNKNMILRLKELQTVFSGLRNYR